MFLQDTNDWKHAYFDLCATTRLARARKIHHTYTASGAMFQINVEHRLYADLARFFNQEVAESDTQDVPLEIFDDTRQEIKQLLLVGPLLRFRRTDEYAKFLDKFTKIAKQSSRAMSLLPADEAETQTLAVV